MLFVTAIKDYIDLLNNVYDSVSGNITLQQVLQQSIIYLFGSVKYLLFYIISFQWLRDLCYLPVLVPQLSSAIYKENFFLESPITNFFTFLETPIYENNKFLIGFLNSFFLSLPISAAHILSARRLLIQGIPAGIASGLGTIVGQTFFLFSILFGLRFFIIPWFAIEPLSYIAGVFLILAVVYNMVYEKSIRFITFAQKPVLLTFFLINLFLSWTEQACIFQYFGNLTFSPEPTILEISSSTSELEFILNHGYYLLGILIGSIFFTSLFGFFCLRLFDLALRFSSLTYLKLIVRFNVIFIVSIIAFTFTSFPFYGWDYLFTAPLGFVSEDKSFQKTFLSPSTVSDTNKTLGASSEFKTLNTEITPFDRRIYLELGISDSFEDLNYQGEYAWYTRNDREPVYTKDSLKKLIAKFYKKMNKKSSQSDKDDVENNKNVTNLNKKTRNSIKNKDTFSSKNNKFKDAENNLPVSEEKNNIDEDNLLLLMAGKEPSYDYFFQIYERFAKELPIYNVFEQLFDTSFSDKFLKGTAIDGWPRQQKRIKLKYYSNPVYKFLVRVDIDFFINRQPRSHSLTTEQENQLVDKRFALANYYDTLRSYTQLPYAEDFQTYYHGSKSFASRIYNQQFKGTLRVVRRLFSITLNENKNPDQKRVLKFDQPLYKTPGSDENPILHEELEVNKTKITPSLQLSNPIPFYTGWDEQLRKLVITNRLLPRTVAGYSVKTQDKPDTREYSKLDELNQSTKKIDFTAWPIPKNILENSKNKLRIPYNVLFESLKDPRNSTLLDQMESTSFHGWDFENVPPNMKKINSDQIKEVVPPTRGGFIWPGRENLKFNLNQFFKN